MRTPAACPYFRATHPRHPATQDTQPPTACAVAGSGPGSGLEVGGVATCRGQLVHPAHQRVEPGVAGGEAQGAELLH